MNLRARALIAVVAVLLAARAAAQQPAAPKVLFETSPRAVEYQLGRLSNVELVLVERKADDPKYRPVYVALLTRKGLGREYFDEALATLMKIDKANARRRCCSTRSRRCGQTMPRRRTSLCGVLLAQPAATLKSERATFAKAIEGTESSPAVLRAAYGAMMIADGSSRRLSGRRRRSARGISSSCCAVCRSSGPPRTCAPALRVRSRPSCVTRKTRRCAARLSLRSAGRVRMRRRFSSLRGVLAGRRRAISAPPPSDRFSACRESPGRKVRSNRWRARSSPRLPRLQRSAAPIP